MSGILLLFADEVVPPSNVYLSGIRVTCCGASRALKRYAPQVTLIMPEGKTSGTCIPSRDWFRDARRFQRVVYERSVERRAATLRSTPATSSLRAPRTPRVTGWQREVKQDVARCGVARHHWHQPSSLPRTPHGRWEVMVDARARYTPLPHLADPDPTS